MTGTVSADVDELEKIPQGHLILDAALRSLATHNSAIKIKGSEVRSNGRKRILVYYIEHPFIEEGEELDMTVTSVTNHAFKIDFKCELCGELAEWKPIEDWLKMLNPVCQKQALYYYRTTRLSADIQPCGLLASGMYNALALAFNWAQTEEGWNYWHSVASKYVYAE